MGLELAAFIVGTVSAVKSIQSQDEAKRAASAAADEQRKAQSEQKAVVASQQADDKRAQIREERVRRARILQSSQNTGASFSSGEAGAIGSLSTQYFSNLGKQLGNAQSAANISNFQQNAANFNYEVQQNQQEAQMFNQLGNLSGNIFDMAIKPSKVAPTSVQPNPTMSTSDYLAVRDQ